MKSRRERIAAKEKAIEVLKAKETKIRNRRMKLDQQVQHLRNQDEAARDALLLKDLKDRLSEHPEEREELRERLADRHLTDEERALFDLPPRDAGRAPGDPDSVADATHQTPQPAANGDEALAGIQDAGLPEADSPDAAPLAAVDKPPAPATTPNARAARARKKAERPAKDSAAVKADRPAAPAGAPASDALGEANDGESPPPAASVEQEDAPAGQESPRPVEGSDPASAAPVPPATDRQIAFIRRLISVDPDRAQKIGINADLLPTLSKRKASWVIRSLNV